jgi:aspartyl-tRNA(Asn)/glutamyl-tRNA(Gln) amidotransferase subunit A
MSEACRPQPRPAYAKGISPAATRRSLRTSGRLALCCSARPICTRSRTARRAKSPRSVPCEIPTISPDRRGGSSGGSAVSLAAGMALGSIGSDTGGSIRVPASACGTVGLKPTYGEVSAEGVFPLARSLDHVGPLARTVTDAWLVYRALLGSTDWPDLALRLWLPRGYFCDLLDDEVRTRFEEAIAALRLAGARVDEVDIPHSPVTPAVYLHIHASEATACHLATLDSVPERYSPTVRFRLEMGRYIQAGDYIRAMNAREVLRTEVDAAVGDHDGLVLPTLPIPAPPVGAESVSIGGEQALVRALMLRLTQLFNLTGHPAVSMPCGSTSQGLPCGLQLVGRRHETEAILRVAIACEAHVVMGPTARGDTDVAAR